ncbi:uncharacterized protein BDR25DRAFT_251681 [Lindgomyces ingoldianus]|uniref:Uncharacterized protein n=1 Tax=Lindgomyces ingoldianus TaxID=673940 RepID=A0ACB6RFK3_9PLEO|nr:uncharacterized protein BDR25DRAFT_251681 [Lindgomyces ingoldianus]KAF2477110.1 hypothetical protein BDR25DRAFT_251681 [Lindgomyces ingoldianus]
MDINSLLSPQDSSPTDTPPSVNAQVSLSLQSPSQRPIRQLPSRTPSGLNQQITSSPQYHGDHPRSPYHPPLPAASALASPGLANFVNGRAIHSATSTPSMDSQPPLGSPHGAHMTSPYPMQRHPSTQGMETLADLAAMTARQPSVSLRDPSHYGRPISSLSTSHLPHTPDMTMGEASTKSRVFTTTALDADNIAALEKLQDQLNANPFDYYSHVSFITILHLGLQAHMYPDQESYQDPYTYELLTILREAYDDMEKKYALGEQLWEYRISDEKALARNTEERLGVIELCNKAVQDEPYSVKLWVLYGEYVAHLIACSHNPDPPEQWSDEDKMLGKEMFTTDLLLSTWMRGADFVKYNMADSHLVWDRYLDVLQDDLKNNFDEEKSRRVRNIFDERLNQPHATWDTTFSNFSQFNTTYNSQNYMDIMARVTQTTKNVKTQHLHRDKYEFDLLKAKQSGDETLASHAFIKYLEWETRTHGPFSFHFVPAVYERAVVHFPVASRLWEDYIGFLIKHNNGSVSLLDVLERATRHCPWSGYLWSQRLLTLENEHKSFEEIERVKHSATHTGLLEHGGLKELYKVQVQWCGYLRRKAFDNPSSTEDDADIAEVGIRSALELIKSIGAKKLGREWKGDMQYVLERIHIKYWTQRGNLTEARHIWNSLVPHLQDSYDFWDRYYIWEMVLWSNHAVRDKTNEGQELKTPVPATAVLERALERIATIDQPRKLLEMYTNHCELHESAAKVQMAIDQARVAEYAVQQREQTELVEAATSEQAIQHNQNGEASSGSKRKRDDTPDSEQKIEDSTTKRSRQALDDAPRERHLTSIIARNVPKDATNTEVRRFFTEFGEVRSLVVKPANDSVTAIVEFMTPEDVDYALDKSNAKDFDGRTITITKAKHTVVFVYNYPPEADETWMRQLFEKYGEVVDVRFPSLKYKSHRNFCYVQYLNTDDAEAAVKDLHGTEHDGRNLEVKISTTAPIKQHLSAIAEGRVLFVNHLSPQYNEQELEEGIRKKFPRPDKIEYVRWPKKDIKGNHKGFCFVCYDTKDNAEFACAQLDGEKLKGYTLGVRITEQRGNKGGEIPPTSTEARTTSVTNDDAASPFVPAAASIQHTKVSARTIAILNIPDTVTDARIHALVDPYDVKKITLRPQNGGAILEFHTEEAMGKASLELDGKEIAPGRPIAVGTVDQLSRAKGEYRPSGFVPASVRKRGGGGAGAGTGSGAAGRGRGRGRRGLGWGMGSGIVGNRVEKSSAPTAPKSNADFKELLRGGTERENEGR